MTVFLHSLNKSPFEIHKWQAGVACVCRISWPHPAELSWILLIQKPWGLGVCLWLLPGTWLDEWSPGLVMDHILGQVFLCCHWFSSFSLEPETEEAESSWVSKCGHVTGFELSCWFFLLSWTVSTLGGVAKPQMDPILIWVLGLGCGSSWEKQT